MRPKVLVCFFTRPRQERTFNEEKDCIFGLIFLKLLTQIRTRLRRDQYKTVPKFLIQDETETTQVPKFCMRPRRDRDSCPSLMCGQ